MNADIKSIWLDALRSGKYQQTTERLRDDSGYCCLGVLCDLHSKVTGTPWKERISINGVTLRYAYCGAGGELPVGVAKWAGLESQNPLIEHGEEETTASNANDNGCTFEWIAERIDKNL